ANRIIARRAGVKPARQSTFRHSTATRPQNKDQTETPMRINPNDVISFAGRDYIVEGTATYHLGGKTSVLARAVDGALVFLIEAVRGEAGDRPLQIAADP